MVRSPMVMRKLLLATEGRWRTRLTASETRAWSEGRAHSGRSSVATTNSDTHLTGESTTDNAPSNSIRLPCTSSSFLCILGGFPNNIPILNLITSWSNNLSVTTSSCSDVAVPTIPYGHRSRWAMEAKRSVASGEIANTYLWMSEDDG